MGCHVFNVEIEIIDQALSLVYYNILLAFPVFLCSLRSYEHGAAYGSMNCFVESVREVRPASS